jgi:hypothetical protein
MAQQRDHYNPVCLITVVETSAHMATPRLETTTNNIAVLINNVLKSKNNNSFGGLLFANETWQLHKPLRASNVDMAQDARNTLENHRRRGVQRESGRVLCVDFRFMF